MSVLLCRKVIRVADSVRATSDLGRLGTDPSGSWQLPHHCDWPRKGRHTLETKHLQTPLLPNTQLCQEANTSK